MPVFVTGLSAPIERSYTKELFYIRRLLNESAVQVSDRRALFFGAYNFGRRLKTLKGLTPYEFIVKAWTKEPKRFRLHSIHQMPGLNT